MKKLLLISIVIFSFSSCKSVRKVHKVNAVNQIHIDKDNEAENNESTIKKEASETKKPTVIYHQAPEQTKIDSIKKYKQNLKK